MINNDFHIKTLCLLILFLPLTTFSQEKQSSISIDNDQQIKLPPLGTLFENAKKNAAVEYYRIKTQEEESTLKSEKRRWLEHISVNSGYQWGKSANTSSFSDQSTPLFYSYNDYAQNWYYIGASMSMPLTQIFDRKNLIKKQSLAVKATQKEMERWLNDRKLKIVDAYTTAEELLQILKMQSESLGFAEAQYKSAKSDFVNGKSTPQDLNDQQKIRVSAYVEFIKTKQNLKKAILELEILSNTKIIK